MKNNINTNKAKGFTIVELLVVIVVIGILAAISIVSYTGVTKRANTAAVKGNLDAIVNAAESYYSGLAYYPTESTIVSGKDSNGAVTADVFSKLSTSTTFISNSASGEAYTTYPANAANATVSATTQTYGLSDTNGKKSILYIPKGTGTTETGVCIVYWDYDTSTAAFKNIGDATGIVNSKTFAAANAAAHKETMECK